MFEENQELINEFVIESREGLAEVESDLLAIEQSGADIDVNRVNKVFRAVHSIKGASGFMGLATIGELSHAIESVLNLMRNKELLPTAARVNVLLESCDVLKTLIEDIAHSDECDVHENVELLDRVARGEELTTPATAVVSSAPSPQPVAQSVPHAPESSCVPQCHPADLPMVVDSAALENAWKSLRYVYAMDFDLLKDKEFAGNIVELSARLGDTGDLLAAKIDLDSIPGIDADWPTSLPCLAVLSSVLKPDLFCRFWSLPPHSIHLVHADADSGKFRRRTVPAGAVRVSCPGLTATGSSIEATAQPVSQPAATQPSLTVAPEPALSVQAVPGAAASSAKTPVVKTPTPTAPSESTKVETNIRVSVTILDRLMNLAGELVLGRNQLLQTIANHDERLLESVGARIDQVTTELQETIMATRMQPVGNVFNKFTRIVRDLSGMLGKQCQLVIEGTEVELDKTIIEAIGDPLTHLIRNSVDHGVESPQVRESIGKPAHGTVHLRAYHQDGKVNISISDDGAGIDACKLRRKGVEKGLITQEKADSMSDAEALRLIFLPGFSTADQVTAISGRGVGMDVVKTNFEKLGGSIEIQTEVGSGTSMTIRLPLTLAIIPSLIVSDCHQRFAVPQVNISELVRIRPGDETKRIERLQNSEVLRLRGCLLPLVRLSTVMQTASVVHDSGRATDDLGATNIIVLESGGLRYGLIVDQLFDSEEIVVKPLGRHMADLRCFAGATVLGDGQIALILDITGLADTCGLESNEHRQKTVAASDDGERTETISTLLFTNHPSEQFGVPMSSVARIERIRAEQIDSVAGQSVLQYRGGTLPLLHLEKAIPAKAPQDQARLYVVVFRAGDREVGLVAPNIIDIRDINSNLDTRTFSGVGLLGSLIVDGKPTRIVDAYDIARETHPEWFATTKPALAIVTQTSTPQAPHLAVPLSHGRPRETAQQVAITIATSASNNARPKMLLAEDSAFFRNKVKQFIEQIGAEVITAEDGAQAWSILQRGEHQFAGIVTDIEMPNMNGFELCERVRSNNALRHLPVIALTSLASDDHIQRGAKAGINEYLIKLDRDKLVLALTSILSEVPQASSQQQLVRVP